MSQSLKIDPIDMAGVKARLMLPDETIKIYIEKFVAEYGDADQRFRGIVAEQDWDHAADFAHSIKGVSSTLGAMSLSHVAAELEAQFRTHAPTDINVLLDTFSDVLRQSTSMMEDMLRS